MKPQKAKNDKKTKTIKEMEQNLLKDAQNLRKKSSNM
jgi:hypothetical protein